MAPKDASGIIPYTTIDNNSRKKNKLLKLMIPNKHKYSSLFSRQMEYIVFMSDLRGKLEYRKKQ